MKARLSDLNGTMLPGSPVNFADLIADETAKWAKVVKFSGRNRTDRNGQASDFGAQLRLGQIASEIRLGRPRSIGIFSRVPLDVFSTNHFRPAVRILHIRHGCCPRRREDIFILDSELELQVFT